MALKIILFLLVALGLVAFLFVNQKSFGRLPRGERLERIKMSPNYNISEKKFVNLEPTSSMDPEGGMLGATIDYLFGKKKQTVPDTALTVIKTDLKALPNDKDWIVWFGHSSYLMSLSGKKVLVDPVFYKGAPVSFANKMFKGTDVYKPSDMPDIDYLVISHEHWDHLDYEAVMELKPRVKKVIVSLGVGEHFEYWGFPKENVVELDWWEKATLDAAGLPEDSTTAASSNDSVADFEVTATPARHFSNRGLKQNQTLWASYILKTPKRNIWIGGDSGYGKHFKMIAEKFPEIDLALLENGQYNKDWSKIHLMPEYLGTAMKELNANRYMTVHNSRFCLSNHSYFEPLENAKKAAAESGKPLLTPQMGEVQYLE